MPGLARLRMRGRERRHRRIRQGVVGTKEKPRLCVFRSHQHIYAQLIDDTRSETLAALSSLSPVVAERGGGKLKGIALSRLVGKLLAEVAREKGIEKVAFDRGGYLFHGRVKALAEGSREGGLRF